MTTLTLLRDELERRKGSIRRISDDSGIAYDTILRIKNGEGDPGFSKVEKLAAHLGVRIFCRKKAS